MIFKGSLVALVTPMLQDGAIDFAAFERLILWHIENQTDGLVILGTTGESATILEKERDAIIQFAIATAHKKIPVIVGTGSNATSHSIERTQKAMHLGADAVLLVTPYYNRPTQEGLFQHFSSIARSALIPQILYNVPSRTACDLLPETIARLVSFPNIVGVKEATGDLSRLQKLLALDLPLDYFSGDDKTAMDFMLQGGRGVISVTANVAPKKVHDLCEASLAGDREKASNIDQTLAPLYSALFVESNPIPTKWLLQKMGLIQGGIRLPLVPLSVMYQRQVGTAL